MPQYYIGYWNTTDNLTANGTAPFCCFYMLLPRAYCASSASSFLNITQLFTFQYASYNVQSFLLRTLQYVTFGSLLSQIRLSFVTFVRPSQGVETFGNISSDFFTLVIH